MTKNVGSIDKVIRIILGAIIIALGIINQSWWGLLGIVPIATSFMGVCPAYLPFNINTCKTHPEKK